MCKIGKVYVIGLGPGAEKEMTYQASTALEKVRGYYRVYRIYRTDTGKVSG